MFDPSGLDVKIPVDSGSNPGPRISFILQKYVHYHINSFKGRRVNNYMPFNNTELKAIRNHRRLSFPQLAGEIEIATGYRFSPSQLELFEKQGKERGRTVVPDTHELDALYEYAVIVMHPPITDFYSRPIERTATLGNLIARRYKTEPIEELIDTE
jgi:hypothetical protein